jgi:hypothetical protein
MKDFNALVRYGAGSQLSPLVDIAGIQSLLSSHDGVLSLVQLCNSNDSFVTHS